MGDFRLDWRGDEVKREVMQNTASAWGEFGLEVEGESKRELRRGHGVESGTLRRSIHVAETGYDWSGDDVEPGKSSPERGGALVTPDVNGDALSLSVGSGLKYAMPVHQGHHSFQGYHYLTNGLKKAKAKLDAILRRHRLQR